MSIKVHVLFTVNNDVDKFKAKAAEVVRITKVGSRILTCSLYIYFRQVLVASRLVCTKRLVVTTSPSSRPGSPRQTVTETPPRIMSRWCLLEEQDDHHSGKNENQS